MGAICGYRFMLLCSPLYIAGTVYADQYIFCPTCPDGSNTTKSMVEVCGDDSYQEFDPAYFSKAECGLLGFCYIICLCLYRWRYLVLSLCLDGLYAIVHTYSTRLAETLGKCELRGHRIQRHHRHK